MIQAPGLRCNRRFTTILNKKGRTLVALMTRIAMNRWFSHSCFPRKHHDGWTEEFAKCQRIETKQTGLRIEFTLITNLSKLQFAVQWLPKLPYGCCWCRIGFLHLHADRKHGNAGCKSYSKRVALDKIKEEVLGGSETPARLRSPCGGCFLTIILHFNASLAALYSRGDERSKPVNNV